MTLLTRAVKELREEKESKPCKGLFWRASVGSYLSKYSSIEVKKSLRLLKNRSCSGCPECDWLWENIKEDVCIGNNCDYVGDIKHGAIYTYVVHSSKGYLGLYPEIDYVEFMEVEEA